MFHGSESWQIWRRSEGPLTPVPAH